MLCDLKDVPKFEDQGFLFLGPLENNRAVLSRGIDDSQKRYYNVAVAASITGFARAHLFKQLSKSVDPVYEDTDSIFADDLGAHTSKKIGDFSIKGTAGGWDPVYKMIKGKKTLVDVKPNGKPGIVAIAGKKLYAVQSPDAKNESEMGWFKAHKGGILTASDIIRIAGGETVKFKKQAPTFSINNGVYILEREFRLT